MAYNTQEPQVVGSPEVACDLPATTPKWVPVECAIIEDSANDLPAVSTAKAAKIASALLGRELTVDDLQSTGGGCWNVPLTPAEVSELETEGIFERTSEQTYLLAEMP